MLDREGPIPVYKQIAEEIHARIQSGDLGPGEAVPSEAELEIQYDIARTTARRVARGDCSGSVFVHGLRMTPPVG
ncbi:GntR family transcriptional regulator [Planomonospora venezuelensis]|uniref:DNA-binding GntR family transcriptional regulator n=1 Tax=Planomonospora venezuelensis TaxID=1999 RepID=A0A841D1U3_PLAVE|nr:GntR family transcriptional regulator [Planomonospora venezuelensis]MBB5964642.1 DNA-binding GntR family transcriptional regulator [Planomonospora venezuelensis]